MVIHRRRGGTEECLYRCKGYYRHARIFDGAHIGGGTKAVKGKAQSAEKKWERELKQQQELNVLERQIDLEWMKSLNRQIKKDLAEEIPEQTKEVPKDRAPRPKK